MTTGGGTTASLSASRRDIDFSTTHFFTARQWIEYLLETRSISPDRVIVVNCCDGGTAYVCDKHWFVTECTGQLVRPLVVTHEDHISHVQIVVLGLVPFVGVRLLALFCLFVVFSCCGMNCSVVMVVFC